MKSLMVAQLDPFGALPSELQLPGDETVPFTAPAMDLLNSYAPVFVVAFIVTLLVTPLVRRLAMAARAIDLPDLGRKAHPYPVATFGGIAVFLGLVIAIAVSYVFPDEVAGSYRPLPLAMTTRFRATACLGAATWLFCRLPRAPTRRPPPRM